MAAESSHWSISRDDSSCERSAAVTLTVGRLSERLSWSLPLRTAASVSSPRGVADHVDGHVGPFRRIGGGEVRARRGQLIEEFCTASSIMLRAGTVRRDS